MLRRSSTLLVLFTAVKVVIAFTNDTADTSDYVHSPSLLPSILSMGYSPSVITLTNDTSDHVHSPSLTPSFLSTSSAPSPTRSNETVLDTRVFAAIANGGFENDVETVISKGSGYYSMLPTGWDEYHAAVMMSYALTPHYYQENSGEIFLSMFAAQNGRILQNVTSCPGMSFFLTFTVASYNCSGCSLASVKVSTNDLVVYHDERIGYEWERHYVSFTSQAYIFALKFETEEATSAHLLLDNVIIIHDGVTCAPTTVPTVYPTEVPSEEPTYQPTGQPTGVSVMMLISAQMTFEDVTYSDRLSEQELSVIQYVLTSYVESAARSVRGMASVLPPACTRLNERAIAVNFDIEVLKGPSRDVFSDKYNQVFNATLNVLSTAISSKNIVFDLVNALYTLQRVIGIVNSTMMITSDSHIFLDFYEIAEIVDHRGQRIRVKQSTISGGYSFMSIKKAEGIAGGVMGAMLLLCFVAGIWRMRSTSRANEQDKETLLDCVSPEVEVGGYFKSAKGRFEKVMEDSSHAFDGLMRSTSGGMSFHGRVLHSLVPTTEEAPLPDLKKHSSDN